MRFTVGGGVGVGQWIEGVGVLGTVLLAVVFLAGVF